MLNNRLHLGHMLLLALAILCAFLAWRAFGAATAPLPAPPRFVMPPMTDRGLLARFDPFFPGSGADSSALPVTALPFTLHGVRADAATGRGSAIIASGDGAQQVYGVGESIGDGVTLAAIASDHVVLDRAGTRETLWLDGAGEAPVQQFTPSEAEERLPPSDNPDDPSPNGPSLGALRPAGPAAGEQQGAEKQDGGAAMVAAAPPRPTTRQD